MSLAYENDDVVSMADSITSSTASAWTMFSKPSTHGILAGNCGILPNLPTITSALVLSTFKHEFINDVCETLKRHVLPEVLERFKEELVIDLRPGSPFLISPYAQSIKMRQQKQQKLPNLFPSPSISLPSLSFIPPTQPSRPIPISQNFKFAVLFISFNPTFSLSNIGIGIALRQRGFHPILQHIPNAYPTDKTVLMIRDLTINLWANNWRLAVFLICDPAEMINSARDAIRRMRIFFDKDTLRVVTVKLQMPVDTQAWCINEFKKAGSNEIIVREEEMLQGIIKNCEQVSISSQNLDPQIPAEFLNSFPASVKIGEKVWVTVEHFVKAQLHYAQRNDWDRPSNPDGQTPRHRVLSIALWHKFTQHPKLTHKLLSTSPAQIDAYQSCADEDEIFYSDEPGSNRIFKNVNREIREKVFAKVIMDMREEYGVKQKDKIWIVDGLEQELGSI
ncbi:14369_t:CDS:2 [Ambispora leptoticha]|uniref:14369_t:CDS:1 n=1 Tax=Ambispora leptoticha TaxID=144679 RepID=A0A9N8YVG9_9GLOM|nr:14369_t:CDS:2 [Ambispora leptoticha]